MLGSEPVEGIVERWADSARCSRLCKAVTEHLVRYSCFFPRILLWRINPFREKKREVSHFCDWYFHCWILSWKLIFYFEFYRSLKVIMLSLSPKFWILTEGLGQFFVKLSSTAVVWKLRLRLVLKKLLKKKFY